MTKLKDNYFEIKRAGINSTFQDNGRTNLNHIGIPISGVMDKRNFILANALLKNETNTPVIEFAYQGPLLEFNGDKIYFVITGDVKFEIIKKNKEKIIGSPYNVYAIEDKDQIDIQSTNKSVYGYLSISENIVLNEIWDSFSTNTKAKIGSNNGEKLSDNQKISKSRDGFIIVEDTVVNNLEFKWWIRAFGDSVEVISPASLRKEFKTTAKSEWWNCCDGPIYWKNFSTKWWF